MSKYLGKYGTEIFIDHKAEDKWGIQIKMSLSS